MSHPATIWAIKQRGLRPTTRLVLWALADFHNGKTGRCDPSQASLCDVCEISRSSLNEHLGVLERLGFIKRIRRFDAETGSKDRTFYELDFSGDRQRAARGASAAAKPQDDVDHVQNSDMPHVRQAGLGMSGGADMGMSGGADMNQESITRNQTIPPTPQGGAGQKTEEICDEQRKRGRERRDSAERRGTVAGIPRAAWAKAAAAADQGSLALGSPEADGRAGGGVA